MKAAEYKNGTLIYREMTAEEIAELERSQAEPPELTTEERLTIMEDAFAELCREVFSNG